MEDKKIINAFTIDVEDYYQVSAFEKDVSRDKWNLMESRVQNNTNRILELLNERAIKATFFILGWVAERNVNLVARIDAEGHEVACHGYSHKLIYNQSIKEFKEETQKAKIILEDIIQKPVIGYRAASYSITNRSLWAQDILIDAGFKYDSSIYPILHDRYGIPGAPRQPYIIFTMNGQSLVEFPLSTIKLLGRTLPVAGGGYFRLYPYWLTRYAFNKINNRHKSFVFYLHPWEIDPKQPKIQTNYLSRFRHYNNLDICEDRLKRLINDFKFTTMKNVLSKLDLL